jgi:ABC-type Mn2+/Zn2+ transport system ATPase subunit
VQQQLIAARDAGAAVLVISDDLDEVLALGDRVAVMHAARLTEARPASAWTREAIGLAMAGSTAPQRPGGARHEAGKRHRGLARCWCWRPSARSPSPCS